jgi:dienelactone hydrolase
MAAIMKTLGEIAGRAASVMPIGGAAQLVPIPVRRNGALRAAVLEYRRSHDPKLPLVLYPPQRVLLVDPESGLLCEDCTEEVAWSHDRPLQGPHPPRAKSVEDWLDKRARLDVLAPGVWSAFARNAPALDEKARQALAEYLALSDATEPLALRPYVRTIGSEFYAWALRVGAPDRDLIVARRDPGAQAQARAAAVLAKLAGDDETARPGEVDEQDIRLPASGGRPARGRMYRPVGAGAGSSPGVVLAHGLSPRGIDDPRLVRLARALAAAGLEVLTPELQALVEERVDPRCLGTVGAAVKWLAARTGRSVGLVGMSLGGGLGLLAAADPKLAEQIAYVLCIGAHHDLERVRRHLRTHPDRARLAAKLAAAGRHVLTMLSPRGQLDGVRAPVFLLHGTGDRVIPASEALHIARELPPGTLRASVLTSALSHVDVDARAVTADEAALLVGFLAGVLAEADAQREGGETGRETGDVTYGGLANAGLSLGEGALARTGGAGAAAARGAKIGAGIGGSVGAAAGTTLVALGILGATTAAFSAVPVIGTVVGAVVGAAAALSYYLGKDKFHPSPLEAAEWLALWRADPGLLFAGVDRLTATGGSRHHPADELAARLVRYFKQLAGEVPEQGPLYNPITNLSCTNPYMCEVDPSDPLTDPRYLRTVREAVLAHRLAPPAVHTPAQAAAVLQVLRTDLVRKGSVLDWTQVKNNLPALRKELGYLRALAGETGDEPVLDKLLGGEIVPGRLAAVSRPGADQPLVLGQDRPLPLRMSA